MNLIKFISYVKSKAISLTANDIKELDSILSDDELPGLELKIKRALNELAIFLNQR
jgi:hypothetical protein